MARPHDIWEFGWTHPFHERHEYIQSLPEQEQEWATLLLHYIDHAFRVELESRMRNIKWDNGLDVEENSDRVDQIRNEVAASLEPPIDDRWKTRFQIGWYDRFYRKETDD